MDDNLIKRDQLGLVPHIKHTMTSPDSNWPSRYNTNIFPKKRYNTNIRFLLFIYQSWRYFFGDMYVGESWTSRNNAQSLLRVNCRRNHRRLHHVAPPFPFPSMIVMLITSSSLINDAWNKRNVIPMLRFSIAFVLNYSYYYWESNPTCTCIRCCLI